MLLAVLFGCGGALREGDYALSFSRVNEDSCDIYQGGSPAEDTTGEVYLTGSTIVLEVDGTDDDLEFTRSGDTFSRASQGTIPLDDACGFVTDQADDGRVDSSTSFSVDTTIVAAFVGSCDVWRGVFGAGPCRITYQWEGDWTD